MLSTVIDTLRWSEALIRMILFLFILSFSGLLSQALAAPLKAQISSQNDTIHLEFTGRESWDYNLKKVVINKKPHLKLTLEKLDESTREKLTSFKSAYVKSIQYEKDSPDGKSVILFELANDSIESFDYLTDQPSRLILDFFVSPQAEKVAQSAVPAAVTPKKPTKKIEAEEAQTEKRNPASTDLLVISNAGTPVALEEKNEIRSGLFDGGDPNFERFTIKDYEIKEEAIIKSKENYYIPFPMLEVENINWQRVQVARRGPCRAR